MILLLFYGNQKFIYVLPIVHQKVAHMVRLNLAAGERCKQRDVFRIHRQALEAVHLCNALQGSQWIAARLELSKRVNFSKFVRDSPQLYAINNPFNVSIKAATQVQMVG